MSERNNDWLPFTHPQMGTCPATQSCALIGNPTGGPFTLQAGTQSTRVRACFLSSVTSTYVTMLITYLTF